jgi:hypothetical protein
LKAQATVPILHLSPEIAKPDFKVSQRLCASAIFQGARVLLSE